MLQQKLSNPLVPVQPSQLLECQLLFAGHVWPIIGRYIVWHREYLFFQMLSHEAQVLKQGLTLLIDVLTSLEPLISRSDVSPLSILLHEVASSGRPQQAMASMQLTPLLHGIVAAHAYISMFLHVCKVGQVRLWFVVGILLIVMQGKVSIRPTGP